MLFRPRPKNILKFIVFSYAVLAYSNTWALDSVGAKNNLYFADSNDAVHPAQKRIRKVDLATGITTTLFNTNSFYPFLRVDQTGGKLYALDKTISVFSETGRLVKMNLDGTGLQEVVPGANLGNFDLDIESDKLFYINSECEIYAATLDGLSPTLIHQPPTGTGCEGSLTYPLVVDKVNKRVYAVYTSRFDGGNSKRVIRFDYQGGNFQYVTDEMTRPDLNGIGSIDIDPNAGFLFLFEFMGVQDHSTFTLKSRFTRVNVHTFERKELFEAVYVNPIFAIDTTNQKIIYENVTGRVPSSGNNVRSISYDGSSSEIVKYNDNRFFPRVARTTISLVEPERAALWQNPTNRFDVNDDGHVTPIDALVVINSLNAEGSRILPARGPGINEQFFDVNGDNSISPIDVLNVINSISSGAAEGEGASFAETTASRALKLDSEHNLRAWSWLVGANYLSSYRFNRIKAKFIYGKGGWHFITTSGRLYKWSGSFNHAVFLGKLSGEYYSNPRKLYLARN